jgi:hypothetical protein
LGSSDVVEVEGADDLVAAEVAGDPPWLLGRPIPPLLSGRGLPRIWGRPSVPFGGDAVADPAHAGGRSVVVFVLIVSVWPDTVSVPRWSPAVAIDEVDVAAKAGR